MATYQLALGIFNKIVAGREPGGGGGALHLVIRIRSI